MSSIGCKCGQALTPKGESRAHTEWTVALIKEHLCHITQSHEKPLGKKRAGEGWEHTTVFNLYRTEGAQHCGPLMPETTGWFLETFIVATIGSWGYWHPVTERSMRLKALLCMGQLPHPPPTPPPHAAMSTVLGWRDLKSSTLEYTQKSETGNCWRASDLVGP